MTKDRTLAALLVLTGIGTLAYWANYFLSGDVQVSTEHWYVSFENSFPFADSWMALAAIAAGIGLWHGAAWGRNAALVAGGALVFLAAMDTSFNLENGLYALATTSPPMRFEVAINAWTLCLGIAAIVRNWTETGRR